MNISFKEQEPGSIVQTLFHNNRIYLCWRSEIKRGSGFSYLKRIKNAKGAANMVNCHSPARKFLIVLRNAGKKTQCFISNFVSLVIKVRRFNNIISFIGL